MSPHACRRPLLALAAASILVPLTAVSGVSPAQGAAALPEPKITRDTARNAVEGEGAAFQLARDAYFESRRLAGDTPLTPEQASRARAKAAKDARKGTSGPGTPGPAVGGTWQPVGPTPTKQVARTSGALENVSGRISSLALDSSGRIYAGAAQGGVWARESAAGSTWTPLTDSLPSLSVGAVAVAPSDERVVYLGTGEGDLSGDSYSGDGFYRSGDRGQTWTHVSGDAFAGVSVARLAIDPGNADHLYAAVIRGRSGARRVPSPTTTSYGVYESTDGGRTWALRRGTTDQDHGATDVRVDPLDANTVYASFLGEGIFKSTDHGLTWAPAMTGLPAVDWAAGGTRAALAVSHPSAAAPARLYAGFDYTTTDGKPHSSRVFVSKDGAAHWSALPYGTPGSVDSVLGYCGTQCTYDNVVETDPTNPDVVFVGGMYNYGLASGGVYRSLDGGATWQSLGYDLHPDFHALALQPGSTGHVVLGNDGGVWDSPDQGGRLQPGATLDKADWQNLNKGLQITQFTSIATTPSAPGQLWGGAQDNGTQLTFGTSPTWYDIGSGDGGQVLVDPSNDRYVYGTHYGISPFRIDTAALAFNGYVPMANGIDPKDRSEFYTPWVMNKGRAGQLLFGTYRVYRTDNAQAEKAGDVLWKPISPDLTSGCTGTAPNGARGCLISAIGVADGGSGVYAGADDGYVSVSPDAVTSDSPTWKRVGTGTLPNRPVTQFAVDRSNWRIAYVAFGGFNSATPKRTGHVFATTNGGQSWRDVSAQLPDAPVNSVLLDPADGKTLYVGTDVGSFVSTDGGTTWSVLGSGIPGSAVWQLDEDSTNGVLAAGTHGRGAWTLATGPASPALVMQTADSGAPVGPGTDLTYTITLRNVGNADATGVALTVPMPDQTSYSSASDGGAFVKGRARWSGLTVPAGGSKVVTLVVRIAGTLTSGTTGIVLDGASVTSTQGASTTSSPYTTPIAPAHALALTPATQTDGGRSGSTVDYPVTVRNLGYLADTYSLGATGSWSTTVLDATCATAAPTTGTVAPGASVTRCLRVTIPAGTADGTTVTSTLQATSTAVPSLTATSSADTIAVAVDTLLVDGDGNAPDVSGYYGRALTASATPFATWDLAAKPDLPKGYLTAHHVVVWMTGNSYPAPITRYEPALTALLQGGGRLLLSGQDLLDQSAGTTPFVHDYLHVSWDGSEAQNDKPTAFVVGQAADPVTAGAGKVAIDHSVLNAAYEDQITPIAPASTAFVDDQGQPDALTVDTSGYKVVFLAFPFEAYGSDADRAALMKSAVTWFSS
ncbi:MAG: hypothetical protein WCD35_05865 [Mycobacteriales bacterium]